jgi:hypothetical protein
VDEVGRSVEDYVYVILVGIGLELQNLVVVFFDVDFQLLSKLWQLYGREVGLIFLFDDKLLLIAIYFANLYLLVEIFKIRFI